MYKYWGFGLYIESEIEFPELFPSGFSLPDVQFIISKVSEKKGDNTFSTNDFTYHIDKSSLYFSVNGVARYRATDGNKILIEPCHPIREMRSIRLYVLATVMAAILLQRNRLPLHASAIILNDKLTLVSGDSGAGKSTLLAGLLAQGHTIFSDDVTVLRENGCDKPLANASYPMIKLWDDTLDKLNDPAFGDRTFKIKEGLDKYGFFFHQTFNTNSYPVEQVFVLKKHEVPEVEINELKGAGKFNALIRQVYRPVLMQSNELRLLCFNLISGMARSCQVYEILRPMGHSPADLVESVSAFMNKKALHIINKPIINS